MKKKRASCTRCQRPLTTCFCRLIKTVNTDIQVIIWQHPSEQNHPKGTAKLLNLCLTNSKIISGEVLSQAETGIDLYHCVLLYPEEQPHLQLVTSKQKAQINQLLVIDGTWRKSRKIVLSNAWLKTLPRLSISEEPSKYTIRKAEAAHQLSTFESTCLGLKKLEPNNIYIDGMQGVFKGFIKQYKAFLP